MTLLQDKQVCNYLLFIFFIIDIIILIFECCSFMQYLALRFCHVALAKTIENIQLNDQQDNKWPCKFTWVSDVQYLCQITVGWHNCCSTKKLKEKDCLKFGVPKSSTNVVYTFSVV